MVLNIGGEQHATLRHRSFAENFRIASSGQRVVRIAKSFTAIGTPYNMQWRRPNAGIHAASLLAGIRPTSLDAAPGDVI